MTSKPTPNGNTMADESYTKCKYKIVQLSEASTPLSLTRLKDVFVVLNNCPCGVRLSEVEASSSKSGSIIWTILYPLLVL
jgi:hypothetical protein